MASIQKNVSPLSRALKLMQLEKKDIFTIIMLTFAAGFLALAIPIAVQTLVNIVAMGNVVQPLIVVTFILFLLLLLAGSFAILEYYIVELIQRRIFVSNALLATAHVQAMHLEVREIQNPVELMNRFFDVTTVQKTSYQLLTKGLAAILQAIIGSIVLIFYSIYFAFGVLVLLFITWVIVRVLGRTAVNSAIDESYAKLDVAAWLETIGRNLSMFKFGSSQTYAMQKTDDLTLNYLALRKKHFSTLLKQNLLSAFFYALVGTSMLGLGGWLVMQGVINLGQFVAAELIIFGVLSAFLSFINKLEYFYDLLAGLDKLGSFEDLPMERKGGHSFQVIQAYSVAVSQIIIPNSTNQSKINLALTAGKNLAIFTHDESTSAYIAELLVGLREPAAGYIKINDIDIRQLDLSAMRHHVAFITHIEVLEESILSNLTLQHPDTNLQQVNKVLNDLGLTEPIAAQANGLNTVLLHSGKALTNTQMRLLMIARAILTEPSLIVVDSLLDALHGDALDKACRALQSSEKGWSLIVVTNIPAIAKRFDAVLEIDAS